MQSCRNLSSSVLLSLAFLLACKAASAAAAAPRVFLRADMPAALSDAVRLGRLDESRQVSAALTLPLRNQAQLDILLARQADPSDPEYGRYLTPAQFAAQFGPTQADYDAVVSYAKSEGLTVTGMHSNRLLLDVSGARDAVEAAFNVHFYLYQGPDGREFRAPDATPSVPATLSLIVSGVVGLSNAAVRHPYLQARPYGAGPGKPSVGIGTGPEGGLAPSDIRAAYNLSSVDLTGSGQTLGVFELDGYTASDIQAYDSEFGLPDVTLQNVLVDGATGTPGSGAVEVTLDIEMQHALATGASKIMVYETANTDAGIFDGYSKMAEDDLAQEISSCWGLDEADSGTSFCEEENPIFEQMAAQGQTIFAAAGDYGAYDGGSVRDGLRVDDPGSQPYVCSAGGTSLTTQSAGGAWKSETTWNAGSVENGAGGGGISSIWPIPSWQTSAITSDSGASSTMRNVPDISLDADPDTGYAIYFGGGWSVYGGTSCATPLWAAFAALVNQERVSNGEAVLGQASPALYPLLSTSDYTQDFHDIADDSNNLYYPASAGYDDATGLGTFNGANLLASLAPVSTGTVPTAPMDLTATAGNTQVTLAWTAATGATSYDIYRSQTNGSGYAKIGSTTSLTYTDSPLTNGATYYYVITAMDSGGASGYSNQASATPVAPASLAAPPTNLVAVPGNAEVTLTWTASSGATSYNVYRTQTSGSGYAKIGSSPTASYTDSPVTNGTTYFYVVTAVDSSGESGNSNVASATPTAPSTVTASFPAGLNFISLPDDYSSDSLASVLGYSDPILAVWNPTSSEYVLTPNSPADAIRLGTGYWARFPQAIVVTLQGTAANASSNFDISLSAGWNQIGNPFPASDSLGNVAVVSGGQTYSYASAAVAGLIGSVIYQYDTSTGAYVAVPPSGSLQPGTGYFMYAASSVTLEVGAP